MSIDFDGSVSRWKPKTVPIVYIDPVDENEKALEKKKRTRPLIPVFDTMERIQADVERSKESLSVERLFYYLLGLPVLASTLGQWMIDLGESSSSLPKIVIIAGKALKFISHVIPEKASTFFKTIFYEWPKVVLKTVVIPTVKVVNNYVVSPLIQNVILPLANTVRRGLDKAVERLVKPIAKTGAKLVSRVIETATQVVSAATTVIPLIIDKVLLPPLNVGWKMVVKATKSTYALSKKVAETVVVPVVNVCVSLAVAVSRVVENGGRWIANKVALPLMKFVGKQLTKVGRAISQGSNWVAEKVLKPLMQKIAMIGNQLWNGLSWFGSEMVWPIVEKAITVAKAAGNQFGKAARWLHRKLIAPTIKMIQKVFTPLVQAAKAFVKTVVNKFQHFISRFRRKQSA